MTLKNSVTIKEIAELLNNMLKIDPKAMTNLFNSRVKCNKDLAGHSAIQVGRFVDPVKPKRKPIPFKHRLGYRFLNLNINDRLSILRNLQLIDERGEDKDVPYNELFLLAFKRAKKRGLLAQLWEAVESKYDDSLGINPYEKHDKEQDNKKSFHVGILSVLNGLFGMDENNQVAIYANIDKNTNEITCFQTKQNEK